MNTNETSPCTTNDTPATPAAHPLFNESHRATYCPEDNKLRLYVGRVPRDQYLKLRSEGWVALHKQRETGGGDFAATWTPSRRDTALNYAGIIEDEDMSPAERAADRAERFSGYRDKRTFEACGHADRYESQPAAHGFQDAKKAERAVSRHEKIGDRASDAWSKAEYWQRRTAGVIGHALYKSTPAVRMGRIKELEADLRRFEKSPDHYPNWIEHTKLRLAYENQMCEAAGGRAALVEMIAGGFIGGMQIAKVNKSAITGQVVSVTVITKHTTYRKGNRVEVVGPVLYNIERLKADAYRPPTEAELAAFQAAQKAQKAKAKIARAATAIPLINPTDADAQRLQDLWNAEALREREASYQRNGYSLPVNDCPPQTVLRITQGAYSAASKGSYARATTRPMFGGGVLLRSYYEAEAKMTAKYGAKVCLVRITSGKETYAAKRVIVLTDKPQKPFPAELWQDRSATIKAEARESFESNGGFERLADIIRRDWSTRGDLTEADETFFNSACLAGLAVRGSCWRDYRWSEAGSKEYQTQAATMANA